MSGVLVGVLGATLALGAAGASPSPSPSLVPIGTAAVVRTTLVSRQQVGGTLGYGQALTLLAPVGASPAQVAQAQSAYDAAAVQLANAQRTQPHSEQDIASAQDALAHAQATYATSKTNSASLMDAAQADIRAFQSGVEAAMAKLDAALGAVPPYGPDARSAIGALQSALTPLANARSFSTSLIAPALAEYLRARNDLTVAIARYDLAIATGGETTGPAAAYSTASTAYSLIASRLTETIDATSAPLTQVAGSVATAQGSLTTSNTRYNALFDASRADLAAIVEMVAREQQLAAGVRSKLAQAATSLAATSLAIDTTLANAARGLTAATSQADQASRVARASLDVARAQLAAAATQLENARASKVLGAGTFTWLPSPGALIERGRPLYAIDDRPVPLLHGSVPMYRQIGVGLSGNDIAQLEQNLVALGFASADTADAHFGADDASAVRAWQASLGLPTTGEIDLGAIVFLPGATRVARVYGTVGSPYAPGQPVLDVTETAKIVTIALDTTLQSGIKTGDVASVQIPGRAQAATGKVSDISAVAQTATTANNQQGPLRATITVTIRLDDITAGGSVDQAPVRVSITDQTRTNVLAVPVTSLIARSDGSFAVRVVRASTRDVVTVVPGIFGDQGLVEVTGNLNVGDLVEIPKPL